MRDRQDGRSRRGGRGLPDGGGRPGASHARFCLSVCAFNSKNHAWDKDSNGNGWFKSGFSIVVSRRKPNGIQTQSPNVSRVLADTDTIFFLWKDPDIAGM